jgi:hypothetical protein
MSIRSTRRIADALVMLLGIQIVLLVAEAFALLYRIRLLGRVQAGGSITLAEADRADVLVITSVWVWLLVFVGTGIVWCVWQYRAQRNAIELAGGGLKFTPGWSVGWWFIPLANLVKPFETVRELWKASHGVAWRSLNTWRVIGWWWALWLAGSALEWGIARSGTPTDFSGFITHDLWRLALLGFEVASAVLAIAIVRSIVELQEGAVASPIPQMPSVVTPVSADSQDVLGLPSPPPRPPAG